MKNILLGKTEFGKDIVLNTEKFLNSRLLFQGISGSWKTETIKTIVRGLREVTRSAELPTGIPQIIFDWEGEYHPLRKEYPFILIGDDGEFKIPTVEVDGRQVLNQEAVEQLATEIRRNQASAIIDLSSFKDHEERQDFAAIFINALLDVEKRYWKPLTVIIDEAHNLCKQGDSRMTSKKPIIALCETGRKRNISTILVTQRLSALDKNASAQMVNRLIGFTVELIDRTAASKLLGGGKEMEDTMKDFRGGEYFAFGSALSEKEVQQFRIIEDPNFQKPDLLNIPPLNAYGQTVANDIDSMINRDNQRVQTLNDPVDYERLKTLHETPVPTVEEQQIEDKIVKELKETKDSGIFDPTLLKNNESIVDTLPDEGKITLTQTQLNKLKNEFRNKGWNDAFEYIISASRVRKKGLIRTKKIDVLDIVRDQSSSGLKKYFIKGMEERCGDCGMVLESHERAICKKCIFKHTKSSRDQLEIARKEKSFTDKFWRSRK